MVTHTEMSVRESRSSKAGIHDSEHKKSFLTQITCYKRMQSQMCPCPSYPPLLSLCVGSIVLVHHPPTYVP